MSTNSLLFRSFVVPDFRSSGYDLTIENLGRFNLFGGGCVDSNRAVLMHLSSAWVARSNAAHHTLPPELSARYSPEYVPSGPWRSLVDIAVASQQKVVLIDEIEAGFPHTSYPKIWRNIMLGQGIGGGQVFAITYSLEMIEVACAALVDNPSDLLYHRLEWQNYKPVVITINWERLQGCLNKGWEVR